MSSEMSKVRLIGFINWALLLFLFVFAFHVGLHKNLHRRLGHGFSRYVDATALAISDTHYHLNAGHVGYQKIYDCLKNNGMDVKHMADSQALNAAITAALRQDVSGVPPINMNNLSEFHQHYKIVEFEDPGIVDFYKLSFRSFGYRLHAMYFMYFVLLFSGLLLFLITYQHKNLALVFANLFLLSFLGTLQGPFLDTDQLYTVHNGRFFSSLGLIPTFHLVIAIWHHQRFRVLNLITGCGQAFLVGFVLFCRNSFGWSSLLLGTVLVLVFMSHLREYSPVPFWRRAVSLQKFSLLFAFLPLLVLWGFRTFSLHPIYHQSIWRATLKTNRDK